MLADFTIFFKAFALLFSLREDNRFTIAAEKLPLLSRMNFSIASMSTDNDCDHRSETSPFEEESEK
jgi:hypothetical protein